MTAFSPQPTPISKTEHLPNLHRRLRATKKLSDIVMMMMVMMIMLF
jgi:hypothetical protein